MANIQILTSKFLSLQDQRWLHDENGELLFEASRPKIFGRIIVLKGPLGSVVATINPQTWKSHPTWDVSTNNGDYIITRNKKSFRRLYHVKTGIFDGAVIEGGQFDQQFRIRHHDKILAHASEQTFSLKAKHVVEVANDNEQENLLAAVVAVIISKEKQVSRANQSPH